jgi:hypothetical protein
MHDNTITSQQQEEDIIEMSKKILARKAVTIRAARAPTKEEGKLPPLIVAIPKVIANAANVKQADQMIMYTDGNRIYLDKIQEPKI